MTDTTETATFLAGQLLYREARFLDEQRWEDWLALYEPDATFWIPSWRSEHQLIDDPDAEISFIYYTQKSSLEERVARLTGGKTVTAQPLPRTRHFVSNVELTSMTLAADGAALWDVSAAWTVRSYDTRVMRDTSLYGSYAYRLIQRGGRLRIARKKIVVVNDRVPTVLDIYSV